MRSIHIFPREKFTDGFINFINQNFDKNKHYFFIYGKNDACKIRVKNNVKELTKEINSLKSFIRSINKSDKIIIHGLFSKRIVLILFLQPWLLKKCYWTMWGGDLYYYKFRKKTFKSNIYEFMRRRVIKNMGGLIPLADGDYDLAKEWYGAKGKKFNGIYMGEEVLPILEKIEKQEKQDNSINILVGNSASETNNHFEIFNTLERYKDENIKVYAPLSYGDMEYGEKVKSYGEELFRDKFVALLDFMDAEKYYSFLNQMDIGIFAHERQQGLGNIFIMLYLGKKVYIRNDISTWKHIKDRYDLIAYNYLEISDTNFYEFIQIDEEIKVKNRNNGRKVLDVNEAKILWSKIFNDKSK